MRGRPFEEGHIPWNRQTIKKNCLVCGNLFDISPSRINKRKHCSKKCKALSQIGKIGYWEGKHVRLNPKGEFRLGNTPWNKNKKGIPSPRKGIKTGEYLECLICGKKFYTTASIIKKGKGKYCSRKCYFKSKIGISLSIEVRQRISQAQLKPRYEKECKQCHRKFKVTEGKLKIQCCSHSCATLLKIKEKGHPMQGRKHSLKTKIKISAYQQGININKWQQFLNTKDRLLRLRFRREIQHLIFQRDNYTCQMCGSKKDLQVDHIQSWAEYVELRFDINNCRTLCAKCHYFVTFGKPMPENIKAWGHNLLKGGDIL